MAANPYLVHFKRATVINEMASEQSVQVEAGLADDGWRLDRYLARVIPDISRVRVQSLLRAGCVALGGQTISDASHRVKPGDVFTVAVPDAVPDTVEGEDIALNVVFEDDHVIVIDKPAGLVVHPAAGHSSGTLVNALIALCGESLSGIGGVKRPGIVHRLDKDTSGLLVVAKTDAAHQHLSEQFKAHGEDGRLSRVYFALVWGAPLRPKDTIDVPLSRHQTNRKKIAVARGFTGRRAVTHFEVVRTFSQPASKSVVSLLKLELETGRTHQIRVHLAHIGHPVLGDEVYGSGFKSSSGALTPAASGALEALGRQALHAAELGFEHPETGEPVHFESTLPVDITRLILELEGKASKLKSAKASDGNRQAAGPASGRNPRRKKIT